MCRIFKSACNSIVLILLYKFSKSQFVKCFLFVTD